MMPRTLALFLLLFSVPLLAEIRDGDLIRFEVVDARSGARLYEGFESIEVKGGVVSKRTVYRAPDAGEVMVEQVRYALDSLKVDEFVSELPLSGEVTRLRSDGDSLEVSYVERRGEEPRRSDALSWDEKTRIGKTLHHIIVRAWDRLLSGQPERFKLLVPSKFSSYDFQLVHRRADPATRDGLFVFRLEPSSWLMRGLVDPMDFYYDAERRAVKYVGPSTVGYYDDPDRTVEIRFSY
jgi:hypothetical protein